MKVVYDPETDTLTIIFRDEPVVESDELREKIIADYGHDEKIVSIELIDASQYVSEPKSLQYEVKKAVGG